MIALTAQSTRQSQVKLVAVARALSLGWGLEGEPIRPRFISTNDNWNVAGLRVLFRPETRPLNQTKQDASSCIYLDQRNDRQSRGAALFLQTRCGRRRMGLGNEVFSIFGEKCPMTRRYATRDPRFCGEPEQTSLGNHAAHY